MSQSHDYTAEQSPETPSAPHVAVPQTTLPNSSTAVLPSDSFPKQALLWLIPGVVGLLIGLALFVYFERRASRQIVFVASNGDLRTVRADGNDAADIEVIEALDDPTFFSAQWSPDGNILASTAEDNQDSHLLVIAPPPQQQDPPIYHGEGMAEVYFWLPGDAWSQDGQHLAVISQSTFDSEDVALFFVNIDTTDEITTELTLNLNGGAPRWHPTENLLLTPTITNSITATLHIMSPDGSSEPFTPADEQDMRMFGDWSPDGGQVAYVGIQGTQTSTSDITRTTILVADRSGNNPRQLVSEGLNSAPFWAPRGDYIFFTRILEQEATDLPSYEFCRIQLAGTEPDCFAQSTNAFFDPLRHRHTIAAWSPDETKFFFQGYNPVNNETSLYVSNTYDGSDPVKLVEENTSHLIVLWSPTNRGLLINDPADSSMFLQWIDQERPNLNFPSGRFPTWQP